MSKKDIIKEYKYIKYLKQIKRAFRHINTQKKEEPMKKSEIR